MSKYDYFNNSIYSIPELRLEYERLIEKFGSNIQLDIAIEELSELIKEIIKFKRGKAKLKEIVKEIIDCRIMIDQVLVILKNVNKTLIEKFLFQCKDKCIIHILNLL